MFRNRLQLALMCTLAVGSVACAKKREAQTVSTSAETASASARSEPVPAPTVGLSAEEKDVLAMYAELSAVFQQHKGQCNPLAEAANKVVDGHEAALQRWAASTRARGEAEAKATQQRLEAAAGGQLEGFRVSIRAAMSDCLQQLQPTLLRLAALEGSASQ